MPPEVIDDISGSSGPPTESPLHEYWSAIVRRALLIGIITVLATGFVAVRAFMTRDVYQASVQVLIDPGTPNVLNFREVSELESAREEVFQTQLKLLQSRALARRVLTDNGLFQHPEFGGPRDPEVIKEALAAKPGESPIVEGAISGFIGKLSVAALRPSRMVLLSVRSHDPDMAARAANGLAKSFIEQSMEMRFQTSSEAGDWLKQQIEEQRQKVEQAERNLQKLREDAGISHIEERRTLLTQRIQQLGSTLNDLRTQRLQKEALVRQMNSTANLYELPEVMTNPVVQGLRAELSNLQGKQAQLEQRFLPEHPEVVDIRRQIDNLRSRINAESQSIVRAAQNDYRAIQAQETAVAAELENAKAETDELSSRSVRYDSMKREMEAANQVLSGLVSRNKETDVAQEFRMTNIRIVDPAIVPKSPILPNRTRDITLGFFAGLVLGIIVALGLEYLDNTIKTPDDVRRHLGVPLLGVIPEHETKDGQRGALLLSANTGAPFAEGYRVLRTGINYSWADRAPRVILVTSTLPGEGKTITSINLAQTFSAGEGKVLLIDADMRKAQIHTLLHGRRSPGLSDVLVGRAKPSEAFQNLTTLRASFMASGTSVPSPADLLSTEAFRGLMAGLRDHFDYVIVDTPPVAAVADALVAASAVDGAIVVVGAEMVPRKAVQHTLERLAETGVRTLGVALNRSRLGRRAGYYGYYGHYYGHYYGNYGRPEGAGPNRPPARPRLAPVPPRASGSKRA